jgi:hypothetical protein
MSPWPFEMCASRPPALVVTATSHASPAGRRRDRDLAGGEQRARRGTCIGTHQAGHRHTLAGHPKCRVLVEADPAAGRGSGDDRPYSSHRVIVHPVNTLQDVELVAASVRRQRYKRGMEDTIRRMAKILGACAVEASMHDARFEVANDSGERLRISLEGDQQRLMAVLRDPTGETRCTVDVAPIAHVTEDAGAPGRATIHIGRLQIHIDSQPSLAIEIISNDILD